MTQCVLYFLRQLKKIVFSLKIGEIMKAQTGHNVKVHYKGTLHDGTEFDNSYVRGHPLDFEIGSRKLIRGFSEAVVGMEEGEKKSVTIPIEAAYGPVNPDAIQPVPRNAFAEGFEFEIG